MFRLSIVCLHRLQDRLAAGENAGVVRYAELPGAPVAQDELAGVVCSPVDAAVDGDPRIEARLVVLNAEQVDRLVGVQLGERELRGDGLPTALVSQVRGNVVRGVHVLVRQDTAIRRCPAIQERTYLVSVHSVSANFNARLTALRNIRRRSPLSAVLVLRTASPAAASTSRSLRFSLVFGTTILRIFSKSAAIAAANSLDIGAPPVDVRFPVSNLARHTRVVSDHRLVFRLLVARPDEPASIQLGDDAQT